MEPIQPSTIRKPATAVALTLIMPGLGHIYCGRIHKGLILDIISGGLLMTLSYALFFSHTGAHKTLAIGSALALAAVELYALFDAHKLARSTRADYRCKDYNHWRVYLLLILMGGGGSLGFALNFRAYYAEAFVIPKGSMAPTIVPGDRIVVNKRAYIEHDPKRGDLAVFIDAANRCQRYIKRVVAVAGDTIEMRDGELYVNETRLERQPDGESPRPESNGRPRGVVYTEINGEARYRIRMGDAPRDRNFARLTVPEHHCFVLGDSRDDSLDSRNFGPVGYTALVGKPVFRYYPVSHSGKLQ